MRRKDENERERAARRNKKERRKWCATCTSYLAVLASCPPQRGKRVLIPYRLIFLDHLSLDSPPVSLSQHECTDATQSQIDYECLTSGSCVRVGSEGVVCPPTRPVARHTLPVCGCEEPSSHAVENISERLLHHAFREKMKKIYRPLETGRHPNSLRWDAGAERERKRLLRYEENSEPKLITVLP